MANEQKHKAEMIFSTVHRSKGMEYDEVFLAPDFLKEKAVEKFKQGERERYTPEKLNEEINLLYVAVTRAKVKLHIPEVMFPKGFVPADNIIVLKPETNNGTQPQQATKDTWRKAAYQPWDRDADEELMGMLAEGNEIAEIARHFGRSARSIEARRNRLDRAGKL